MDISADSWREDQANLKNMQRRRKELVAEIEADRRKIVCPWRPGGLHIAQKPWRPFVPRDHRPPVPSASESQAASGREAANETQGFGTQGAVGQESMGGSKGIGTQGKKCEMRDGGPQRPHTAPTPRKRDFMDKLSVRARRILAAQQPGTPLHSAFSTYSNYPYLLASTQGSHKSPAPPLGGRAVGDFSPPGSPEGHSWTRVGEGSKHAWAEITESASARGRSLKSTVKYGKGTPRPHSAAPEAPGRIFTSKRRQSKGCDIRNPGSADASSVSTPATASVSEGISRLWREKDFDVIDGDQHGNCAESRNLQLQGDIGVTVLCSRLCGPSDMVYKRAAWPSRPERPATSRPCRRKARTTRKVSKVRDIVPKIYPDERENESHDKDGAGSTSDSTRDELNVDKKSAPSAALDVLEDRLSTSSWRRVNQRRKVFRYMVCSRGLRMQTLHLSTCLGTYFTYMICRGLPFLAYLIRLQYACIPDIFAISYFGLWRTLNPCRHRIPVRSARRYPRGRSGVILIDHDESVYGILVLPSTLRVPVGITIPTLGSVDWAAVAAINLEYIVVRHATGEKGGENDDNEGAACAPKWSFRWTWIGPR